VVLPPLAFIFGVIGLVQRQNRAAAISGMVLSGLCMMVFFAFPLLMMICK
jgi:hypothetical protein